MSNPPDLRIRHSLACWAGLRDAVASFAKRKHQLRTTFHSRHLNAVRRFQTASESITASREERLSHREEAHAASLQAITQRSSRRESRIRTLQQSGLAEVAGKARRAKERRLEQLQMQHFEATRALPENLEAEKAEHTEFGRRLAAAQSRLATIENTTLQSLASYPIFVKTVRHLCASETELRGRKSERDDLFDALESELHALESAAGQLRRMFLVRVFGNLRPALLISMAFALALALGIVFGPSTTSLGVAAGGFVVLILAILGLHHVGWSRAREQAHQVATRMAAAAKLAAAAQAEAERAHRARMDDINTAYQQLCEQINQAWSDADQIETNFAASARKKLDRQVPRMLERQGKGRKVFLEKEAAAHAAAIADIEGDAIARTARLAEDHAAELERLAAEEAEQTQAVEDEWLPLVKVAAEEIERMRTAVAPFSPEWTAPGPDVWPSPKDFPPATRFGGLALHLGHHIGTLAESFLDSLPCPREISVPLSLTYPDEGSMLFETAEPAGPEVFATLNHIILRLLWTMPPGKVSFTIIDPVGLGQNFAGLMHLSDFEESLINRKIWTQRDQIDERLEELSEQIEKVIQMYLRNEYATITEYNAQEGSVAEKVHFLVVADFPAGFSEVAARRLQSIAVSGARCGVFTLLHWDRRQSLPDGFDANELRRHSVCLRSESGEWTFPNEAARPGDALVLDPPPDPTVAVKVVLAVGQGSIDSNRVEVPFSQISPQPDDRWTLETANELRIPIGRTGATKLQYLAIGKGTRQHALFAGKTGSGKSTLFHVIITNLALSCSPDEVEFYLIDFKKGVEFKCYAAARLPHARVVAIESDREFGLSVLRRVDEELKRRGDLFRKLGVQDLAGYKREAGGEPLPRTLLIIDEFQEFFVQDDQIAQSASLLFDRIVRQGRAFGIHVLLGSQTLGGAYTLARATLGQMVIRVALQCNEADAYLIMDDSNPAPRLLSRPGEGIYNDAAGALAGNSPFQVVWLSDEERDAQLEIVRELAEARGWSGRGPIVFEGNAPADIRENTLLSATLRGEAASDPIAPRFWIGSPNSIKGPTEIVFQRQTGSHLLIVGQRDEAIQSMLFLALVALHAQLPPPGARFFLLDASGEALSYAGMFQQALGGPATELRMVDNRNLAETMRELGAELQARTEGSADADVSPIFVFIHGVQKFRKLRREDDFSFSSGAETELSPADQLAALLSEGSAYGIHVVLTFDTFNNVSRFLNRKALAEVEMRVAFQMSASDSASLIDSPEAGNLGLHRALFYNEQMGTVETFRPYAPPDFAWREEVRQHFAPGPDVAAKG